MRRPTRRTEAGHVDLARDGGRARVVLLEEAGQDLVVGRLAGGLEEVHVAPDHLAVAQDEQHHGRLVVLAGEADEVQVGPGEGGHLLALHRPLDGPDLVPQRPPPARTPGARRRAGHLLAERLDQRLLAALEEQLDLLDVGAVVGLRDGLDAGALAALDVVQEARPLERPLAVLDVDRAGPEREQPPDEVHRLVDARRRRVRPEVAAAVVGQLAGPLDAREVVAERDLDVRVALVVLEPDVEARLEALDEVGLEEQRLADAVDLGHLDVGDPVDDLADAVDVARAADDLLLPVAADAVAQALGLADVQHVAPGVLHQVHAGAVRQSLERRFEVGGHPPMVCGRAGRAAALLALAPWPSSPRAPRRSSRKQPAARPSIEAVTVVARAGQRTGVEGRVPAATAVGQRGRDRRPTAARRDDAGRRRRSCRVTPSTERLTLTGRVRPRLATNVRGPVADRLAQTTRRRRVDRRTSRRR